MKLYINLFLFGLVCVALVLSSCKKDKECTALVTITDEQSNKIAGATVRLFYTDTNSSGAAGKIDETKITDANGRAEFTFDLEAILFIEASKDSMSGSGIIRLMPGETAEETVVIKY